MPLAEGDEEARTLVTTFVKGLQELGWTVGRNVSIDYRWADDARPHAPERAGIIAQRSSLRS